MQMGMAKDITGQKIAIYQMQRSWVCLKTVIDCESNRRNVIFKSFLMCGG